MRPRHPPPPDIPAEPDAAASDAAMSEAGGGGFVVRDAGRPPPPVAVDAAQELGEDLAPGDRADAGMEAFGSDAAGSDAFGGDAADAAVGRAPRPGDLAIVEILANPAGSDLGREWIEIANIGGEHLDLSQLHVADATTDVPVAAPPIAPGALLVLAQSADPAKNGGLSGVAPYGTRLILNNDDERVAICLGACATGVVLAEVALTGLGADYEGRAATIDPATRRICPAADAFGTAGDHGTPGLPNPACATPDSGSAPPPTRI